MKKKNLFIATLLVVAATTIAVVSCKKENQDTLLNNNAQPVKTFTPPQVDDMNAYLKEFKQKMKESQYAKDAEMLSLEEAAWHLSSVANYDFANANVEFTDLRYDTLRYQVDVTDGQVSMTDLNALYSNVAYDIDEFYHSLNLEEKHFRFIGADISESGEVTMSLITSYVIQDHWWYFQDSWEAGVMCDSLFTEDSYVWNTTAKTALEYAMNLLEGRTYAMLAHQERTYYLYLTDVTLQYEEDYTDPYGSPFEWNSRLFVAECDTYAVPRLNWNAMCYCLDSYLGLGFTYVNTHSNMANVRPVSWRIRCRVISPAELGGGKWHVRCHDLQLRLATYVVNGSPIQY